MKNTLYCLWFKVYPHPLPIIPARVTTQMRQKDFYSVVVVVAADSRPVMAGFAS